MLYPNSRGEKMKTPMQSSNEESSKNDHKDEKTVNRVLETNNQIRRKLLPGENCLFKAFSKYMYHTSIYSEKIKTMLYEKLNEMILQGV